MEKDVTFNYVHFVASVNSWTQEFEPENPQTFFRKKTSALAW